LGLSINPIFNVQEVQEGIYSIYHLVLHYPAFSLMLIAHYDVPPTVQSNVLVYSFITRFWFILYWYTP